METNNQIKHRGPHPGILAIIFMVLFNTGLSFVISLSGTPPYFPPPWEPARQIASYFQNQPHDVLLCSFFHFCSAIPLGLFTVAMASRLRFLGNKAVGPYITLFGGVMTAINLALAASILWTMAYPGIAQEVPILRALYYVEFAIGGVGYSVPMGLLIAGIAVSAGLMKLLPKWLVIIGLLIAVIGEASCLSMVFPKLIMLIPLTRFPGFIWLIFAGFMLPRYVVKKEAV